MPCRQPCRVKRHIGATRIAKGDFEVKGCRRIADEAIRESDETVRTAMSGYRALEFRPVHERFFHVEPLGAGPGAIKSCPGAPPAQPDALHMIVRIEHPA
ncbi:hypothetical protein D9M72_601260 [compost metagenome]